jgi:hypothetical protein
MNPETPDKSAVDRGDEPERADSGPNDTILPMPGADAGDDTGSGTTSWDLEDPQADEVPEEHPTI